MAEFAGSVYHAVDEPCRGCGMPLVIDHAWMEDGCPCNTAAGVNNLNPYRWHLLQQLQQRQARELEGATKAAGDEKDRRVYYQSIVYDVCNALDRIFGKRISRGEGLVCGTVETPTRQVQDHMAEVVARCKEWAEIKAAAQTGDEPAVVEGEP